MLESVAAKVKAVHPDWASQAAAHPENPADVWATERVVVLRSLLQWMV